MEYPRHLHKPGGLYVRVENADDHEKLTARGWLDRCPAYVEKPKRVKMWDALREPLIDAPVGEDAADEAAPPKRRGRKPKDE